MVLHQIHGLLFFFNDTATSEIYTLSLHDALPICSSCRPTATTRIPKSPSTADSRPVRVSSRATRRMRSEEHTSELQSRRDLVCRLLLEKKNSAAVAAPLITDLTVSAIFSRASLIF